MLVDGRKYFFDWYFPIMTRYEFILLEDMIKEE